MNKAVSVSIFMVSLASVLTAQQQIPTGGRIPDRRGFNNSVDNPKLTDPVEEVVRRVAGNVYVIAGAGGNIVVQVGSDGLLLVDDNFTVFYPKIMAVIRQISDKPVRIIINTHWHPDHNQNNANFAKQGSLVFAHPNTRAALAKLPGPSPLPPEALPVVTSSERMTFHLNGEDITYVPSSPRTQMATWPYTSTDPTCLRSAMFLPRITRPSASRRAARSKTSSTTTTLH